MLVNLLNLLSRKEKLCDILWFRYIHLLYYPFMCVWLTLMCLKLFVFVCISINSIVFDLINYELWTLIFSYHFEGFLPGNRNYFAISMNSYYACSLYSCFTVLSDAVRNVTVTKHRAEALNSSPMDKCATNSIQQWNHAM